MPTWLVEVVTQVLKLLLKNVDPTAEAKTLLVEGLKELDSAVMAADARVTGPFKGMTDVAAEVLHAVVVGLCAVLAPPAP